MTVGNGSIPLRIGRLINTTVYGGPYRDVPVHYWGVKMAAEITHPHMVSVPTRDFCVPKVSDLQAGIVKALMAMINEEDVYVGCMGGIGRTGIFLAALAKVQIEYRRSKHRAGRGEDPVLYVRKHFIPHAVETKEQEQFIADLDVSNIVAWLDMTQTAMGLGGLTPAKVEPGNSYGKTSITAKTPVSQVFPIFGPDLTSPSRPGVGEYTLDTTHGNHEVGVYRLAELVERDLDWMDAVDADSATEAVDLDDDIRFDDLYFRIDELEVRLGKTITATADTFGGVFEAIKSIRKQLTKPTMMGRLRALFK